MSKHENSRPWDLRSDERLTLKNLYGGQFTLSTQFIKPSSMWLVCWNKTILDISRRLTLLSALRPYKSTILKAQTVTGWLGRRMYGCTGLLGRRMYGCTGLLGRRMYGCTGLLGRRKLNLKKKKFIISWWKSTSKLKGYYCHQNTALHLCNIITICCSLYC